MSVAHTTGLSGGATTTATGPQRRSGAPWATPALIELAGVEKVHRKIGITLVPALLVLQIPLRRAVRLRPGEALRYA